ncbi:MAG: hypothetical protein L0G94_10125 [Brachybacterium sp.]|uniref:hypothetical protein n=1 Tax=Brachybacterium sp. TaxID=1891286 RepID=UPI0026484371|nr:hypothetical protein [Brachybacterium sp.]MDN5687010.1 hypothetical protein [Brachybacterium sp.]
MGGGIDDLFMHSCTVETYQGSGAYGDSWADESGPIRCLIDGTRKRVRDEHGDEVASEATILAPLTAAALFRTGSRVHYRDRTAVVISCKRWDGDALDLPSHTEVALT